MITQALEEIHTDYVSNFISIYPWLYVTVVSHPFGIGDTGIEVYVEEGLNLAYVVSNSYSLNIDL